MKVLFIAILILGWALQGHANIRPGFQFLFGATSMPLSSVTTSNTAKKGFLGELYNPLGLKYSFDAGLSYQYSVSVTTTKISLISNKDKDKGSSSYMTQLQSDLIFSSTSNLLFKSQLGILMYEIKGSGGTVELQNGTSTATFDLPSRTINTQTVYVGGGAQYDFGSFTLESNLNIQSLISNTRRSFFLSLILGVPL